MAVLWGTRQTLDVNAGQALDASACAEGSWMVLRVDGAGLVALLLAGLPGGRVCLGFVLFVPLAGLLEVLFKLLLCPMVRISWVVGATWACWRGPRSRAVAWLVSLIRASSHQSPRSGRPV